MVTKVNQIGAFCCIIATMTEANETRWVRNRVNDATTYSAWECPRCHRVNALWVPFCPCGPYVETVTGNGYVIAFEETIFSETELWDRLSDEATKLSDD